jgi:hypothetical protein
MSGFADFKLRHAELVSASIPPPDAAVREEEWMLKQVQHDDHHVASIGF